MPLANVDYENLQLRFDRKADGTYAVLAIGPDGRTGSGTFEVPITDEELDRFVQRVGLVRRRRTEGQPLKEMQDLGAQLFDAVMRGQIGTVYQAARADAEGKDRGLRISLCLSGAPELMRLPWEFLYRRPRFLAHSTRTPVVRTLDLETARRPSSLRPPLRILGVVSSPTGYPELDTGRERENLEEALATLLASGHVELEWLDSPTLGSLGRRVAAPDDIHVIHYIGHGAYDEASEAGILVLETTTGRPHDVSGDLLGAMLQDEASLRLVVLNACEGARTSRIDPFSGVASKLTEFDIPAVIGMQFEISDAAAIAFSQTLYNGLAQGLPVDAAMAPARRAILAVHTGIEFGTPVLFLRTAESRLFDLQPMHSQQASVEPRVDDNVPEGQATPHPTVPELRPSSLNSPAGDPDGQPAHDNTRPRDDRAVELISHGLRARSWRLTRSDGVHEIHYRLRSITQELVVDGERTVDEGKFGRPLHFTLKEGGREIPCQVFVTLKWDNFAVATAELIIEGKPVYRG